MNLRVKWLLLRMRLNIDPWARAANRRNAVLQEQYAKDRIRQKAVLNDAKAKVSAIERGVVVPIGNGDRMLIDVKRFDTDTIIARPVRGESVIDLKRRPSNEPERSLTAVTADGYEVQVYDPTDETTAALMRRFEMGDTAQHERDAVFIRCENETDKYGERPTLEWEGDTPDPFEGVKRL